MILDETFNLCLPQSMKQESKAQWFNQEMEPGAGAFFIFKNKTEIVKIIINDNCECS